MKITSKVFLQILTPLPFPWTDSFRSPQKLFLFLKSFSLRYLFQAKKKGSNGTITGLIFAIFPLVVFVFSPAVGVFVSWYLKTFNSYWTLRWWCKSSFVVLLISKYEFQAIRTSVSSVIHRKLWIATLMYDVEEWRVYLCAYFRRTRRSSGS